MFVLFCYGNLKHFIILDSIYKFFKWFDWFLNVIKYLQLVRYNTVCIMDIATYILFFIFNILIVRYIFNREINKDYQLFKQKQ